MGRKPKSSLSFFSLFRPIFTVLILSAFVLGISFFVKTLATTDVKTWVNTLDPLLSRLHIDEQRAGQVAGEFVDRLSQTGKVTSVKNVAQEKSVNIEESDENKTDKQVSFKVAFIADSHDSIDNLKQALNMATEQKAEFVFFLGDYTNYGEIEKLTAMKQTMDAGALNYLSLPGDHDLYKSVGPQNFIDVFGKNHFVKVINGVKFVGLDNSANYTTISSEIMAWFKTELVDADYVVLSQPLYHPTFNVVMGIVNGDENVAIRAQALSILDMIRGSSVRAIISADQHMSSKHPDSTKPALSHIVVGALAIERNLQTPRFAIFSEFEDGTYQIDDVLLK